MIDSPTRKHAARSSLTDMVNIAVRIEKDHYSSLVYDIRFDGGEFSGPATHRASLSELRHELKYWGWTALDFDKAITERCGARWYHYRLPFCEGLIYELIAEEDKVMVAKARSRSRR